jgi:16S rRNA (uracil1498-N3)-methyltransferase
MEQSDIALIIGPEGGLTDEEIKLACHYDFLPLSLGSRILRTETAAITALSVLQAVGGDL